ncbi:hypothetical protein CWI71_03290 [Pseudidiomarina insulisalsae]|uniref:Uncharacterized protein n=1 Tax=Pseudidiomarina insulisalsae TaxID=575789 RepID=A0A432YNF8_9GAMM|nr:hypothetical protein [Pseudidiomarina insulisalsae]RUO62473.1 hypothetical protein CWI71_03290 [Pseudidiomarina insulisalsae]
MVLLDIGGVHQIIDEYFGVALSFGGVFDVGQHNGKFIATDAGKQIAFIQIALQPLGHMLQQGVANIMTKRVIDIAQVVKVEHDHGKYLIAIVRAKNLNFQLLLEVLSVGQLGQRVKPCLKANGMNGQSQAVLGKDKNGERRNNDRSQE